MKIERVHIDKKTNSIIVDAEKSLSFPLSKLEKPFRKHTNIKKYYADEDLGREAVTIETFDGEEESIHLDSFLEHNNDPDYYRNLFLYEITVALEDKVISDKVVKSHISKVLETSMTQIYRTLDTTNYTKTIDQVVKFLAAIGYKVDFSLCEISNEKLKKEFAKNTPFHFLKEEDTQEKNLITQFNGLKMVV